MNAINDYDWWETSRTALMKAATNDYTDTMTDAALKGDNDIIHSLRKAGG